MQMTGDVDVHAMHMLFKQPRCGGSLSLSLHLVEPSPRRPTLGALQSILEKPKSDVSEAWSK